MTGADQLNNEMNSTPTASVLIKNDFIACSRNQTSSSISLSLPIEKQLQFRQMKEIEIATSALGRMLIRTIRTSRKGVKTTISIKNIGRQ